MGDGSLALLDENFPYDGFLNMSFSLEKIMEAYAPNLKRHTTPNREQ